MEVLNLKYEIQGCCCDEVKIEGVSVFYTPVRYKVVKIVCS
jgi:hypothetical protein